MWAVSSMQASRQCSVIPLPSPNTFAGLMEIYEYNYIKIKKLCHNFNKLDGYSVSKVRNGLDLHLFVVEKTKYTITLNLTYHLQDGSKDRLCSYPNVFIRVYFDAMQAEVVKPITHKRFISKVCNKRLSGKWRENRFLFKWLSFCLHQGHTFGSKNSRVCV